MAWSYEIRGSENRLVELRCGFATEQLVRDAAERAKRMIDCIRYPEFERLTVLVREHDNKLEPVAECSDSSVSPLDCANREFNLEVKYPWQQQVVDAFLDPQSENLLRKIAIAECTLSRRLVDPTPFQVDERLALGEALLALRRLLRELRETESSGEKEKEDIA